MFPHSKHVYIFCLCFVGYSCYFFTVLVHHSCPSSLSIISDCSQRRHRWYCKYTHVTVYNKLKIQSFFVHISFLFSPPERGRLSLDCFCQIILKVFKGIVHPEKKILSSIPHPQVDPNLYDFLSPAKHKRRFFWRKFFPLTFIVLFVRTMEFKAIETV